MASFDKAHSIVLGHEGGYQANPADTGNYACGELIGTKYGIAAPTLQRWLDACPSQERMKNLEKETAKQIYYNYFWQYIGGDMIADQQVAEIIYDAYVNQTGYTKNNIKEALSKQGYSLNVSFPLSNMVINAINNCNPKQFFNDFKAARKADYITEASGQKAQFLDGWLSRLNKFQYIENDFMASTEVTRYIYRNRWYAFAVMSVLLLSGGAFLYNNIKIK